MCIIIVFIQVEYIIACHDLNPVFIGKSAKYFIDVFLFLQTMPGKFHVKVVLKSFEPPLECFLCLVLSQILEVLPGVISTGQSLVGGQQADTQSVPTTQTVVVEKTPKWVYPTAGAVAVVGLGLIAYGLFWE